MRRTLLLLSTMALFLLLASGVALAAPTTFSNTSAIQIPDSGAANPYPSEITVQGLSDPITDVNVKLNGLTHGWPDDVGVQVVGPDGTSVLLMSDVGGPPLFGDTPVNGINLTLDDEAANSLLDNGSLTTGAYKPTKGTTPFCNTFLDFRCFGYVDDPVPTTWPTPAPALTVSGSQLSGFDGKVANGTWKLYVIDDTVGATGTFAGGWSLEIDTSTDTTPPTVTGTVPAPGVTNVARGVNVKATFSEDMLVSADPLVSSITGKTFKLFKKGTTTKIAATVSYNPTTRTATLNPFGSTTTLLARGTTYKAVVTTGAKDVAGNQLDQSPTTGLQQKAWLFTVKP
jgi:subtilisin-like proprotein convertase family protein